MYISPFYIMKAHHLTTSGRKLGLKKIIRDEPNTTILVATREHGYGQLVECYILGCPGDYGVKAGDRTTYTIDTGNGYKNRNSTLHIERVIQVKDGVIVEMDGRTVHPSMPLPPTLKARYTWVMK